MTAFTLWVPEISKKTTKKVNYLFVTNIVLTSQQKREDSGHDFWGEIFSTTILDSDFWN